MAGERFVSYFEATRFSPGVLESLNIVKLVLDKVGVTGYIKGGTIRDHVANLLFGTNLFPNDIDLMISGGVNKVVELLKKGGGRISKRHNRKSTPTFGIDLPSIHGVVNLDIGILLGKSNTYTRRTNLLDLIENDAKLSDFTANSLFLPMASPLSIDNIIDPLGGIRDIKEGIIRMVAPNTFVRNPECMLRAIVLADRLRGRIEPDTLKAIRTYASLIKRAPTFVVEENMKRIIGSDYKTENLQLIKDLGLFSHLIKITNTLG